MQVCTRLFPLANVEHTKGERSDGLFTRGSPAAWLAVHSLQAV